MNDAFEKPLDPVSPKVAIACGVVMALFSCLFWAGTLLFVADMVKARSLADSEGQPVWQGAAVMGAIALVTGFMALRLLRSRKSGNRVTTLPIALLQALGWLLLAFSVAMVIKRENFTMLTASFVLSFLLITLGRRVAAQQRAGTVGQPDEDAKGK